MQEEKGRLDPGWADATSGVRMESESDSVPEMSPGLYGYNSVRDDHLMFKKHTLREVECTESLRCISCGVGGATG